MKQMMNELGEVFPVFEKSGGRSMIIGWLMWVRVFRICKGGRMGVE